MGCVSSNLLNNEEHFSHLGGSALGVGHHIVSLTSTTYGLLNLDPPPPPPPLSPTSTPTTTTAPTPPNRFTLSSLSDSSTPLWSQPSPFRSDRPEVINSWELMSGLDPVDSFREQVSSTNPPNPILKENSNPNFSNETPNLLNSFEMLCPPKGENRVVIYTTTLRGIRKTFEACNAVRAAMESFGVAVCERDISMDRGFKDELRDLMKKIRSGDCESDVAPVVPRVFVKGRYVGGAEEVMRIVEEGRMGELLEGVQKGKGGSCCEGCGNARFLPCFACNGSCKIVTVVTEKESEVGKVADIIQIPAISVLPG
ncbi:Uncharacterized protein At5g39865 [Linum grandiflorum]